MKLFFVSLGCDKNLVDSEKMLALLLKHNIVITDDAQEAEVIIINTCGFIRDAKEESIETILEMAEMKTKGHCHTLIVTGCLAQRYTEEIPKEIPEVDAVVGTTAYDRILEAVQKNSKETHLCLMRDLDYLPQGLTDRVRTSSPHISYLKIAEGCNKRCTYCSIPSMRGNYRSVPMEELLDEAEKLAASGTKELLVIAQETTVYGVDLYGEKKLPELLHRLCRIPGIQWLRVLYCYPEEITDELLFTIQKEKKICHYLDLPIQHCNDEILHKMGRKTDKASLVHIIEKIRGIVPDMALRTTLISGFPGETEQQHRECVEFVAAQGFDRLGVFPYSDEEGTPAAEWEGQIPEEIRQNRADEIMEAEQNIIFQKNEEWIGKKCMVMVDGFMPEDNVYIGRTYRDAPDIDGCVFFGAENFSSEMELVSGTLVPVCITKANGYDLIGEIDREGEEV